MADCGVRVTELALCVSITSGNIHWLLTVPQGGEAVQPNGEMLEPGSLNGLHYEDIMTFPLSSSLLPDKEGSGTHVRVSIGPSLSLIL